jgi:GNAT superfamily N-acetyltransferase
MSEILQDLSAPALAAAIEANEAELYAFIGRAPQAQLFDDPDLLAVITGVPHPIFNAVCRARLAPDTLPDRIEAALAPFKARQIPMSWLVGPTTEPADLGRHLEAQGRPHGDPLTGMAADLLALNEDGTVPAGFTIETVQSTGTLKAWIRIQNHCFGVPESVTPPLLDLTLGMGLDLPWRYYLGRLHGEPVAISFLFLGAGVAGIYAVATLPHARRQGIGAAITLAPLRDARAMGYRVGTLSASPMGVPVYQRLGFQQYCELHRYVWSTGDTVQERSGKENTHE